LKSKVEILIEIDRIYEDCHGDAEPEPEDRAKTEALEWVTGGGYPISGDATDDPLGRMAEEEEVMLTIEELKRQRNELPEYSLFGDPNWRMTDAQVEILQWVIEE